MAILANIYPLPHHHNKNTKLMKTLASVAIAILSMALLASCDSKKVYDQYSHTPIAGWEKNDTLLFNVPKLSQSGTYSSDLMLRINASYPFMSLTLIVEQKVFPARTARTDTLKCDLIDKNGNTNGQGVSYFQYNFHVSDMVLQQGDSLQISVRHDMKREILPGVSDIGMKLSMH